MLFYQGAKMDSALKKQYGLLLRKAKETAPVRGVAAAAAFAEEDEGTEDQVDVTGASKSAHMLQRQRQAERLHELALAEDPTIFDYDASYEEIERKKNEKVAEQKKKDAERKPKYAEEIKKAYTRRQLEQQSRDERKQQKERVEENGEFADKEVFVTGAYKEQLKEVAKFREEEEYEARFNQITAVEKQQIWQTGFSRNLLQQIARDGEEPAKNSQETGKKERHARQRLHSHRSVSPEAREEGEHTKKSIYDDDLEDIKAPSPPRRNFTGELKPGLNRVNKKTKSQAVRERMFTPSPPPGTTQDRRTEREERSRERSVERREDRRERSREEKSPDRRKEKEEKKKREEKKVKDEKTLKAERMEKILAILARRNGPEEIDAMRLRYFQRRDSHFVTLPL